MSGSSCTDKSPGHTGTQALTYSFPPAHHPGHLPASHHGHGLKKGQCISRKAFPAAPTDISPLHSNFPYTTELSSSLDILNANQNKSFHFRHAQTAVFHGQREV